VNSISNLRSSLRHSLSETAANLAMRAVLILLIIKMRNADDSD
jgi:hypothetical protein